MPPMEQPPLPPQAADAGAPPAGFGGGVADAQAQMGKSPAEVASSTCEKILLAVQDEAFRPYALKAIASLKVGVAMAKQSQPQSGGMQAPPPGDPSQQGGPGMPVPPVPGQMPA